ncbi:MAG: alpha,alpha-trehalose-phosphate synthase (UDP-forming) [Oceanicaulis sp.]
MHSSQRLIIVSNRAPADGLGAGGLAAALSDALIGREAVWFGWSGEIHDDAAARPNRTRSFGDLNVTLMDLTEAERDGYYLGYSNRTLWPALHYRLDLSQFEQDDLATYRAVNARFADRLAEEIRPGDLVWVHDYHLIPLAEELRKRGLRNPIGFFLHIPFPPGEIFGAIPGADALVSGLQAYDLVGFQSDRDRANFERLCLSRGAVHTPDGRLAAKGRLTRARAYPIGIDAKAFRTLAERAEPARALAAEGVKAMIGVDRMDYSKGLPERMAGIGAFFDAHPEACGTVSLVQITPTSRADLPAYADLRRELDEAVGHVNGRHGRVDWTPVHYLARGLERDQLAGLFRRAAIGLVTPLRDGMNLVAKEYVAAQDPEDPGVLILSEFAGAAEQMPDALLVNPHDSETMSDAIWQALNMPLDERKRRHAALWDVVDQFDAAWWSRRFESDLKGFETTERAERGRVAAALSAFAGAGAGR